MPSLRSASSVTSPGSARSVRITSFSEQTASGLEKAVQNLRAQAKGKTSETELQIIQVDKDLVSEVSKDLREANDKIGELIERKVTAEDQLRRVDIRSPQDGIVLQVGTAPEINIAMGVGQVSESVQVEANAAQVETRSVGVGNVIENQRILELPLNGRQATDLISLAGGAVQTGTTDTRIFSGRPMISIAGMASLPLGGGQVDSSGKKGPGGKFPRFGQAASSLDQGIHQGYGSNGGARYVQFHDILCGLGACGIVARAR